MKKLVIFLFISVIFCFFTFSVYAQGCDPGCDPNVNDPNDSRSCVYKINKCQQAWNQMEAAKQPHVAALNKMEADIAAFQAQIKTIEADVAKKSEAISQGEQEIAKFLDLAGRSIRQLYIRSLLNSPFVTFFSHTNIGTILRTLVYQQLIINQDKKIISQAAVSVTDLEDRKKALEQEESSLAYLKAETDKRAESVRKLVNEANAYETQLTSIIASLTAQQQAFLSQKLAGLGIPLFAISGGGCSSDLTNGKDPGFSGFGLFTFGVPNRVGLNQYGAYGRANNGETADQILHAYYNFDGYQTADSGITIRVNDSNGFNSGNIIWSGGIEDYVKRIYEVPNNWPTESLRAQVIAVRSYVLAATNNGNMSICANQNCQVFQTGEKGGSWSQAVNDTEDGGRGRYMVQGGNPIKAFFSSTHGGYAFNTGDLSGWSATSYTKRMVDTPSGSVSGFSDLKNNAYDRNSPWFYCDWGGRSAYGGTAWLKTDEMADIVNVILLAQQDSSTQPHLVQTDKSNPDQQSTWSPDDVQRELRNRGVTPFTSINNVSVGADFSTGRTTSVVVSGNAGTRTFDGNTFKTYFNLRAPANIQIVGPLFNVEQH